jgi:hypothetical protein
MELTHGKDRSAVLNRIEARAMAIYRGVATTDEDLHDSSDINANEPFEILKARELAAAWNRGESLEARFMPGITNIPA